MQRSCEVTGVLLYGDEPLGSRTEPAERWLVRHRTPVRVSAVPVIVFAIGQIVYLVATGSRSTGRYR